MPTSVVPPDNIRAPDVPLRLTQQLVLDAAARVENDKELSEIETELRGNLNTALHGNRGTSWDKCAQERLLLQVLEPRRGASERPDVALPFFVSPQMQPDLPVASRSLYQSAFSSSPRPWGAPLSQSHDYRTRCLPSSPRPIPESSLWAELPCPEGTKGPRGEKSFFWNRYSNEVSWEAQSCLTEMLPKYPEYDGFVPGDDVAAGFKENLPGCVPGGNPMLNERVDETKDDQVKKDDTILKASLDDTQDQPLGSSKVTAPDETLPESLDDTLRERVHGSLLGLAQMGELDQVFKDSLA